MWIMGIMGIIHVDCITNAWLFWESQKGISGFPKKIWELMGRWWFCSTKFHEFCMNNIEQWQLMEKLRRIPCFFCICFYVKSMINPGIHLEELKIKAMPWPMASSMIKTEQPCKLPVTKMLCFFFSSSKHVFFTEASGNGIHWHSEWHFWSLGGIIGFSREMISGGRAIPSGNLTICYWKLPFIVSFPIKNGDFP